MGIEAYEKIEKNLREKLTLKLDIATKLKVLS